MDSGKKYCWFIGIIVVVLIGVFVIPPIVKRLSNLLYKSSLDKDEIDFDNLGPEIVKKNEGKKEDEV